MPRLSLYKPTKGNDYKFFDRTVREQFFVGGTDLFVHKYMGSNNPVTSKDKTQPFYEKDSVTNIQDLLFLENRDRKYETDIFRIRGHYQVQNLDFDLSQFGLFLTSDVIFITVHYNDMIDIIGRKFVVGDVLELPHLTDYHPLNETIPIGLRRYYHVTDGNWASEGFSPTWYPHIWRIKCEPLVDSQEFSTVLNAPTNTDNYMGTWDKTTEYPAGYVVSFGDKNYISIADVPVGIPCTDEQYWRVDDAGSIVDIISTYNKNIAINDAVIEEAKRQVAKSGYDRSQLYLIPEYDGKPMAGSTVMLTPNTKTVFGNVEQLWSPGYVGGSLVLRVGAYAIKNLMDMSISDLDAMREFIDVSMSISELEVPDSVVNSDVELVIAAKAMGGYEFGRADNTIDEADSGVLSADIDPRFKVRKRFTPRNHGNLVGYVTGDGTAPNGLPTGSGTVFPDNPADGDYFLRIDYLPQILYRWNGAKWMKISSNVRTSTGLDTNDLSLKSSFINNRNITTLADGSTMPEKQALSEILRIRPD